MKWNQSRFLRWCVHTECHTSTSLVLRLMCYLAALGFSVTDASVVNVLSKEHTTKQDIAKLLNLTKAKDVATVSQRKLNVKADIDFKVLLDMATAIKASDLYS